jgi:Zn-finger protein
MLFQSWRVARKAYRKLWNNEKGNVVHNQQDVEKIIKQMDIIGDSLNKRASKLENGKSRK